MRSRRVGTAVAVAALGAAAALGVAACGDEEREGTVEIQGGTTGTAGGTTPSTTPTLEEPATVDEAPPETTTTGE